jgi:hypothetical protein
MPGMRSLADTTCPECDRAFYVDLPAGHGLTYPVALDQETGETHYSHDKDWFAEWLEAAYADRQDTARELTTSGELAEQPTVLVNCLDTLYGHALLKLWNVQYYLDETDLQVVVLVQDIFEWAVPADVDAIWAIDLPLSAGTEWNDRLAAQIQDRLSSASETHLSVGFSHPHPTHVDVERFTGVEPFDTTKWDGQQSPPTVTFVWRDDRRWETTRFAPSLSGRLRGYLNRASAEIGWPLGVREQRRRVIELGKHLRDFVPDLEFAVAGIGTDGSFPNWIEDKRVATPTPAKERDLCRQYATSHVVVGVHGSNLLLPSAHAGSVVELLPPRRWENVIQDLYVRPADRRDALYQNRILPVDTSVHEVARAVSSLISGREEMRRHMAPENCDHDRVPDGNDWDAYLCTDDA